MDVLWHGTAQTQAALTGPYVFWLEAPCARTHVRGRTRAAVPQQNAGTHPMAAAGLQTPSPRGSCYLSVQKAMPAPAVEERQP